MDTQKKYGNYLEAFRTVISREKDPELGQGTA